MPVWVQFQNFSFHCKITEETVKKTDILAVFTSDSSPLIFTLNMNQDLAKGKGLWRFKNSLALNSDVVIKMKAHIANTEKFR